MTLVFTKNKVSKSILVLTTKTFKQVVFIN